MKKLAAALAISVSAFVPLSHAYEVAGVSPGMTPQQLKAAGFTECKSISGVMLCSAAAPTTAKIGRMRVTEVVAVLSESYSKVEEVRIATSAEIGPTAPKHCRVKGKGQWADVVPPDCALDRSAEISKVFGPANPGPWIARYVAGWTDCKTQLAYLRRDGVILLREAGAMVSANCKAAEDRRARGSQEKAQNDDFIRSMKQ